MKRLLWILVIGLWIALLTSSLFTRIEADDYCYAGEVQVHGLLGSVPYWYSAWSGSYSEHFTSSLFALFEPYGARVAIPAMLGAFVLMWWYAFANWYPRRDALLLVLAFGAALALSRPNDDPIYWISGLVNYWVPLAASGLLIGALVRRQTALAAVVAFFAVAFSEVTAVLILAGLGVAFLFWKEERRQLLLVGFVGATGFLITALAPGNAARSTSIGPLTFAWPLTLREFVTGFALTFFVTLLSSLMPGLFLGGVGAQLGFSWSARRLPFIFLVLTLAGAFLLQLLATFTLVGGQLYLRSMFPLNILWLAQFFFVGVIIGARWPIWRWWMLAGIVLLIPVVQELPSRMDYARRWDARHAQIQAGEMVHPYVGRGDSLELQLWITNCAETWYDRNLHFYDRAGRP